MKTAVVRAFGLVASVVVAGVASGQSTQAVEWKVSDGGNGHWYSAPSQSGTWPSMRIWGESQGGHLATITNISEWQWLKAHLNVVSCFVGGYQDHNATNYSEPFGGWRWVTGEPFVLANSYMQMDDCPGGSPGSCGCGSPGAQDGL